MKPKITRHPDATTLVSFAAGTLAEPLAAVIAAHTAMCPQCRDELGDLDLLGAALMHGQPGAARDKPGNRPALPFAMNVSEVAKRTVNPEERLPTPIAAAYDLTFENIPWKRLGPGVWHHRLSLSPGTAGDLRLLKIAAGRLMPDHGHGGSELTLVLDGAFSDVTGEYRHGDLQDVDESVEHKPLTDAVTGCICLIASERPARFKGLFGRLFQPLTGM